MIPSGILKDKAIQMERKQTKKIEELFILGP